MWNSLTSSRLEFTVLSECLITYFIKFGKFAVIISLNILPLPFSFPSGTLMMCILVCLMMSYSPLRLCSLFFNLLSLFLKLSNFHCLFKFAVSFFYLLKFAFESLQWIFHYQLLHFSSSEFLFLCKFSIPLFIFPFVHILFSWLSPHIPFVLWTSLRQMF